MKQYYFVSYHITSKIHHSGFGNIEIGIDEEVARISQVAGIKGWIENELVKRGYEEPVVTVLNYVFLRTE